MSKNHFGEGIKMFLNFNFTTEKRWTIFMNEFFFSPSPTLDFVEGSRMFKSVLVVE